MPHHLRKARTHTHTLKPLYARGADDPLAACQQQQQTDPLKDPLRKTKRHYTEKKARKNQFHIRMVSFLPLSNVNLILSNGISCISSLWNFSLPKKREKSEISLKIDLAKSETAIFETLRICLILAWNYFLPLSNINLIISNGISWISSLWNVSLSQNREKRARYRLKMIWVKTWQQYSKL